MKTLPWENYRPDNWENWRLKFAAPLTTDRGNQNLQQLEYLGMENVESWTGKLVRTELNDEANEEKDILQTTGIAFDSYHVLFGKLRPYLAKVFLPNSSGICSTEFLVLEPIKSINRKYLFYTLLTKEFIATVNASTFGSKMPRANWDFIGSQSVPVPPISEQNKIVNYLDRETTQIDNLIAAKEQMLTLLEEKREALISQAVTRGLDPNVAFKRSGLDWLGDIPQHWNIERAKGLFREVDNRTTTGEEELLSLRMHVGLVPHHDVSDKMLEPKDVIGFKKAKTGQLVINRMRASMGLIAISPQDGLVSPDYAVFDIVKPIHIPYFLALFNTSLVGALFRSSSKGLGTGSSGFLRLYSESFLSIHFPIPSLDEQKEITNFLDQEQQRTGKLEKALTDSIALLKERRSALITAAVTGQIVLEEMKK